MTVEYVPKEDLKIDGIAEDMDSKIENIPIVELVGSVVSVEGKISRIVVESELDQTALDGLTNQFGIEFERESTAH